MLKCKLIDSIGQSDYIAAGRTDKGVHAVNNVFSIIGKFFAIFKVPIVQLYLVACRNIVHPK